uniref:Uncharacterized protein n=1 Tax=Trypanosoma congolense (strain IL3000) TaxID=1068625 RepID=G0V379_TRYCI|nr:hypothetical protein, unlikely [Trypanosoma congolense IL3000]
MDRKLVEIQAVITRREAEFRKQNSDLLAELIGEMKNQDNLMDKNMKELQLKLKGLEKQKLEIIKAEDEVKEKVDKLKHVRTKLAEQMNGMKNKMDCLRKPAVNELLPVKAPSEPAVSKATTKTVTKGVKVAAPEPVAEPAAEEPQEAQ